MTYEEDTYYIQNPVRFWGITFISLMALQQQVGSIHMGWLLVFPWAWVIGSHFSEQATLAFKARKGAELSS